MWSIEKGKVCESSHLLSVAEEFLGKNIRFSRMQNPNLLELGGQCDGSEESIEHIIQNSRREMVRLAKQTELDLNPHCLGMVTHSEMAKKHEGDVPNWMISSAIREYIDMLDYEQRYMTPVFDLFRQVAVFQRYRIRERIKHGTWKFIVRRLQ